MIEIATKGKRANSNRNHHPLRGSNLVLRSVASHYLHIICFHLCPFLFEIIFSAPDCFLLTGSGLQVSRRFPEQSSDRWRLLEGHVGLRHHLRVLQQGASTDPLDY